MACREPASPDDATPLVRYYTRLYISDELKDTTMLETGVIQTRLKDMQGRSEALRGYL